MRADAAVPVLTDIGFVGDVPDFIVIEVERHGAVAADIIQPVAAVVAVGFVQVASRVSTLDEVSVRIPVERDVLQTSGATRAGRAALQQTGDGVVVA